MRAKAGRFVCLASAAAMLSVATGAGVARAEEPVQRFFNEGTRESAYEVPAGVTSMTVVARGARGFGGGLAAEVSGVIDVHPGEILYIEIGEEGKASEGGFNGGGAGRGEAAGGGGGATDVRTAPRSAGLSPDTRLVVAAGSGGSGSGGARGGAAGAPGESTARLTGGGAGTLAAGGAIGSGSACSFANTIKNTNIPATPGALGSGGEGWDCQRLGEERFPNASGGGGGGGYFGGGGGAVSYHFGCIDGCPAELEGSGGGGGSSLVPEGGTLVQEPEAFFPAVFLYFEEPQNAPALTTRPASEVTAVHATLAGTVTAEFRATTCQFEYGPGEEYGHTAPCPRSLAAEEYGLPVTASVSGLEPGTTYHYRLSATNEYGTSYGSAGEFTTRAHEPPTITGFTPTLGGTAGGTTVTVTGTGLDTVTKAGLDEAQGTDLEHLSPTELSFVTPTRPSGIDSVEVVDDIGDRVGTQGGYVVQAPPVLLKASSKKGTPEGGYHISLTGEHLENAEEVLVGSTPVPVTQLDAREVSFVAPAMTVGKYFVRVLTPGGTSVETKKATYQVKGLTVSGVSPASGALAGGTRVTVTGAGFAPGSGTSFLFKKTPGTGAECASTTACTVTAPQGVEPGAVQVTAIVDGAKSKNSVADRFTYE